MPCECEPVPMVIGYPSEECAGCRSEADAFLTKPMDAPCPECKTTDDFDHAPWCDAPC